MNINAERIEKLRKEMASSGIDIYFVPMSDIHDSEYVAPHFKCVEFLSGFSGSAGQVAVTKDGAWLFTDGRYFIQAARQIKGSGVSLMKMGEKGVPEVSDFIAELAISSLNQKLAEGKDISSDSNASRVLNHSGFLPVTVGFDGNVISTAFVKKLIKKLNEKFEASAPTNKNKNSDDKTGNIYKLASETDLVGKIWEKRPKQIFTPLFILDEKYTGESAALKINRVRRKIDLGSTAGVLHDNPDALSGGKCISGAADNASSGERLASDYTYLLNSLDDIAWLFNIRANDIEDTPVPYAFAKITPNEAVLYVNGEITPDVGIYLDKNGVTTEPYSPGCVNFGKSEFSSLAAESRFDSKERSIDDDSAPKTHAEKNVDSAPGICTGESENSASVTCADRGSDKDNSLPLTIYLDETRISFATYKSYADAGFKIKNIQNPTALMRAVKNLTEIKCLKKALIKDSAVQTKFMYWLKSNVGKVKITEVSAADYLLSLREAEEGFIEQSFGTIAAYKENAAMMHYQAKADLSAIPHANNREILPEGMLLVDSGGQYVYGTTDTTRTFILGPITDEEKKCFTLTAVSMLRLMHAKFMKGCTGENLDIIAREPMWKEGMDYKCGTGHGVGHVLGVHEGPQSIRWKISHDNPTAPLEEGMIVTDEPGVYKEGKFGIRLENELLVKKYLDSADGSFLEFENLTFVPIDTEGIDKKYMTAEDITYLNEYNAAVCYVLSAELPDDVKGWLKKITSPI